MIFPRSHALSWLLLAALAGSVAGCRRGDTEATDIAEDSGPRYPLTGEVLKVDPERRTLLVNHDEIPGYMPAMTMEFTASLGDIANARPGQRIQAELVPSDTGDFLLEKIWPADPVATTAIEAAARALNQDTVTRGRRAYREVGENLPDFALYDQNGEVVSAARFRGKQIMLNFIFTRCPVATMCPAATANMMTAQRLAREAGVTDVEFISITLDPEYDTPGVLREFALTRGIDTTNFSLLTGPERAIKNLLTQFGLITELKGSILNHTLATLLIDAHGRIVWRVDGSQWSPPEFVRRMKVSS
jgi:protein SCO1/2